jgi:hypothetical protein
MGTATLLEQAHGTAPTNTPACILTSSDVTHFSRWALPRPRQALSGRRHRFAVVSLPSCDIYKPRRRVRDPALYCISSPQCCDLPFAAQALSCAQRLLIDTTGSCKFLTLWLNWPSVPQHSIYYHISPSLCCGLSVIHGGAASCLKLRQVTITYNW